ncbi:16933_t:CDS:2 [Funneliformis mosseae]|uniref:16933_t:CDS:1 n=1 Tax=Funneliformis mosseae TaxID=27381 RepID=A0A9N8V0K4_FUNMO|nr:16933_t:CDS:2 [Funneliformis mosseae]
MSKRSQRESYSTDQNNKDPLEPSSSKRVRFQTSDDSAAAESNVKEEGEYEFDHETSLEKAKLRRGAVKLQGYASDETDTSDDDGTALFNRRKGKDKADDLDDMFADDDDISSKQRGEDVIGKKKVRYLELDEIEGQEYTSRDAYDEESGEPIIEAFNMKAEMEEGRFDEAGNYVRNKKDPSAFHDNWLQGLSQKDIEKAKRAHEKQEQDRKLKEAEEASRGPLDRVSIWKELLAIMKRALQEKKKGKTDETMEMAIDKEELTPEEVAEQERKKQIEILTDLSDKMMALGHFNVYDDTWEQILRNLKREKAVPEDWIPGNFEEEKEAENDSLNTPFDDFSSSIATTQQLYWEYKWTDTSDANSNDIYGPFSGEDMKAWNDQGFFAQGVLVRKAGTEDEFTSSTGIDFTSFT